MDLFSRGQSGLLPYGSHKRIRASFPLLRGGEGCTFLVSARVISSPYSGWRFNPCELCSPGSSGHSLANCREHPLYLLTQWTEAPLFHSDSFWFLPPPRRRIICNVAFVYKAVLTSSFLREHQAIHDSNSKFPSDLEGPLFRSATIDPPPFE